MKLTKNEDWRVSRGAWEAEHLIHVDICNILNVFVRNIAIFIYSEFFLGWSILKIMEKSGYFRYLFLGFKFFSLLGEYFDVPCWELRIDVSKSHTHKMIWFIEKIGYFLSRWPTKPFSQIFSLIPLLVGPAPGGY